MIEAQNWKYVPITVPGAIVDNAAFTTAAIDTIGYNYCTVIVQLGALDIALAALKVEQSDDDGAADAYATVTGLDFSVSPAALPAATADNKAYAFHINLLGKKRYLNVSITGGDGAAGTYLVAAAILSRAEQTPTTVAQRGFAAELSV